MEMEIDADAPTTPSSAIVPAMTGDNINNNNNNNEVQTTDEQSNKRRRKKSIVWEHFTIETVGAGCMRACCKQCKKSFAYITGSKLAGTSHLKRHIALGICPVSRQRNEQSLLTSGAKSEPPKKRYRASPGWPGIPFDQDRCTQEIAKMIIQHDYPLNIVEHPAFVEFVRTLHPQYNMVSFNTIQGEIVTLYLREKQNLLNIISGMPGRVSLSVDLGMSNQSIGYAYLTGHFLDSDWILHRRLLNVVMLPFPDSDYSFNQAVVACLSDWHLENKLFTLTLDQSFANETMIGNLRALLNVRNPFALKAQLLKGNCYARVLSRLAQDGLGSMGDTIRRIRESVKYVKTSDAHDEKFNELRQQLQVPSKKELIIDDQSKWNTTYHMLVAACELKEVFACLDTSDPVYKINPSVEDWKQVEVLLTYLKLFYDAANILSVRPYPPANAFYHEVSKIQLELTHASVSVDPFVSNLTKPLKEKFDKYWRECFLILAVAVVMDPRFKMKLVEFSFSRIFGEDAGMWIKIVDDGIHELFEDYLIPPHLRLQAYGEGHDVMNLHLHGHHDGHSNEAQDIHSQETGYQVMNSEGHPSEVNYQEVHPHEIALQEMHHSEFNPPGLAQEVSLLEAISQEAGNREEPSQEVQTSEAPPSEEMQTPEAPPSEEMQTPEAPQSEEMQTPEAPPSHEMQTSEAHPQETEAQESLIHETASERMDNKEVVPPEKVDIKEVAAQPMEIERPPDQETNTQEAHLPQRSEQDTATQDEFYTHGASSQQMNEQEGTYQEGLSQEVSTQEKEVAPQEKNGQESAPKEMNGQESAPNEMNGQESAPNEMNGLESAPQEINGQEANSQEGYTETEQVVEETKMEEAPVEEMQSEETPVQSMTEEAPVQDKQNEVAPVQEKQNEVEPVQEKQNMEALVQEMQNEEVPSDEIQNGEGSPGEKQNEVAASGEKQNEEAAAGEKQNEKAASVEIHNEEVSPGGIQNEEAPSAEVQNETAPSGEMQKEEMPVKGAATEDVPPQEVNTHEAGCDEIPSQEAVHEDMQVQAAADQEMHPQQGPSQEMHTQVFPEEMQSEEHPQELHTQELPSEEMETQQVSPEQMQSQEDPLECHSQEVHTELMHSQEDPQEFRSQEEHTEQMHSQEDPQEFRSQEEHTEQMQSQEDPQEFRSQEEHTEQMHTQSVPTEEMQTQQVLPEQMQSQEDPEELHSQEVHTEQMQSQEDPEELHSQEVHIEQMHSQEIHTEQMHSQEIHTEQMHSQEIHTEQMHSQEMHTEQMHSQEMHTEQMHSEGLPQEMNIDDAQHQDFQDQVMSQDMHSQMHSQMLSREIKHENMHSHSYSEEMKHEDMNSQDLPLLSIGDGLSDFDVYISEITSGQHKSELDQYLEESLLPRVQEFDVLGWWRLNKIKYPTLSKLAADILSIPVSTVTPESVFDTQNKKIDNYQSSLRPVTLEALVCAKDWLQYGSSSTLSSHDASNAL